MRSFCAVMGFLAAIGFAGSANARATLDLIWETSGTTNTDVESSSVFVQLNIVYTNDQQNVGGFISLDYSNMVPEFSVDFFTSNPNMATTPFLPLMLGATVDTGSPLFQIQAIQAAALPPYFGMGLPPGQSYLLGTVTFHKDLTGDSEFSAELFFLPSDSVAGEGLTICNLIDASNCDLGTATVNVPEPGFAAVSLTAGLVLFGLFQANRLRRNR